MLLAVLHFDENGERDQAQTKSGNQRWSRSFSKSRSCEEVVRPIKIAPTFGKNSLKFWMP